MLRKFAAFPQIQVIDLDAAMGRGANDDAGRMLASKAVTRVGGGVRTVERAQALLAQGAHRVIVGTGVHRRTAQSRHFCNRSVDAIGRDASCCARFEGRPHRGERLAGSDGFTAEEVIRAAGALLLRLPLHLCRQRRHDAGHGSRLVPPPARRHGSRDHRGRRHHRTTLRGFHTSTFRVTRRKPLADRLGIRYDSRARHPSVCRLALCDA
jgi:hypothetical protein